MNNLDDFVPSSKGTSKLASLFGLNKNTSTSDNSLTYTAPKQPKTNDSPKKGIGASNVQLQVILPKTVQAYKLVEGTYQPLGITGITLLGCKSPPIYQLLLYKTREEVHCKIRITQNFLFSVLENNYVSFYADIHQNFSVMFGSSDDLKEFSKMLLVCKSFAEPLTTPLSQDLSYGDAVSLAENSTLSLKFTCYIVNDYEFSGPIDEGEKIVRESDLARPHWVQAVSNIRIGSEKAVILPSNFSDSWSHHTNSGGILLVEVKRVVETIPASLSEDKCENVLESSAEESSIKEKGAVIKEALSGRSQKSALLSRVARMGQATLPLRGAIAADPSDSEEESLPSPKPRTRIKPQIESISTIREPVTLNQHSNFAQPLAVYQPPLQSQIILQRSDISNYGIVSSANSALPSPTDASLSAHFVESRTQATELRMGLAKVADKVDLVLNKIHELNMPASRQNFPQNIPVDPSNILANIQALVNENESLHSKVEDQQKKIEILNERVFQLLELSHKNIEKNSRATENQDLENLRSNHSNLLKTIEEKNNIITNLNTELENLRQNITDDKKLFTNKELEYSKRLSEVEDRENSYLQKEIENNALLAELKSLRIAEINNQNLLQTKAEELEKLQVEKNQLENLKSSKDQWKDDELRYVQNIANDALVIESKSKEIDLLKIEISDLQVAQDSSNKINRKFQEDLDILKKEKVTIQSRLDEKKSEITSLRAMINELQNSKPEVTKKWDVDDVKKLMNQLYRSLLSNFELNDHYSGSEIKQALALTIREMTLTFLQHEENVKVDSINLPSISLQETGPVDSNSESFGELSNDVTKDIRNQTTPYKERFSGSSPELGKVSDSPNNNSQSIVTSAPSSCNIDQSSKNAETSSPESIEKNKSDEKSCKDNVAIIETEGWAVVKETQWKEEDYESWRISEPPPPPPLFDEEENDFI